MGARSGGGGSGASGAGKASRELMTALQSGKFEKMSAAAQERLLEAADKEATRKRQGSAKTATYTQMPSGTH